MVGDRVDVEAHRAGNMPGEILGAGIPLQCRKVERAIDHHGLGSGKALDHMELLREVTIS